MQSKSIAQACTEARDLIIRDGFTHGDNGWEGRGGWCVEGALARVLGIVAVPFGNSKLSHDVNQSEVGQAIHAYLPTVGIHLPDWRRALHIWNDDSDVSTVVRVLAEVAAAHPDKPRIRWDRIINAVSFVPTPVWMTVGDPTPEPTPEPESVPSEQSEGVLVAV